MGWGVSEVSGWDYLYWKGDTAVWNTAPRYFDAGGSVTASGPDVARMSVSRPRVRGFWIV